jgi:phosphate starvation-inducible PhoH-like protein
LLYDHKTKFEKIYLIKSVTTLKGEELGYLKGDLQEKFEPYMWSFMINMEKVVDDSVINGLFDSDIIRPFPLAYSRGVTFDNCIIIADEIQNVSIDNCRTLLTRIGNNSKMILLGDSNQIDLKNKQESSLEPLFKMFSDVENIGCVRMSDEDDNCRNPIITTIEDKFKLHFLELENNQNGGRKSKKQIL